MNFSQDQIQQLYTFTRKHFVEHYDLQTELVDHLANGIEQQQEANSKLTFHEALQIEFKKFDVCGFHDVIKERRNAMSKKYRGIIWHFLKEWFQLSKLILTITLIVGFYGILMFATPLTFGYFVFIPYFFACLLFFYRFWKLRKQTKKKTKKWLLEELIFNGMELFTVFMLPFHILNSAYIFNESAFVLPEVKMIVSIFIVILFLLMYIISFVIPKKAEKLLEETYPEYKLA